MTLVRRSITSSAYNLTANTIEMVIGFFCTIVLTRLLAPEVFGVYVFASSIIAVTSPLASFGLRGAFIQKTTESEGEEALKVHFTLTLVFSTIWAVLVSAGVVLFAPVTTRWVFWIILSTTFISNFSLTPRSLLIKQVVFRRLAALQIITAVTTTIVSIGLALKGFGLWSLLSGNIVYVILEIVILYVIRPVWRPQIGFSRSVVNYFLSFGSKIFSNVILNQALDRVDDIYTGAVLGSTAMGFYSRAYKFATYPRSILARPLNAVIIGTYAQLKGDRSRLSQAFFQVNALMIRVNFLLAGGLFLIAPEFIRLILGAKWLPMLDSFRLMLLFTLLDPIKVSVGNVINTSGKPEKIRGARLIQLAVMIVGLTALGPVFGIEGVAIAVNLMLIIGICILFWEVKAFVDFSIKRLFVAPASAFVFGITAAYATIYIPGFPASDWLTGTAKAAVFSLLYVGSIILLERGQIQMFLKIFKQLWPQSHATT